MSAAHGALLTNVFETWESQANQNPFLGTGDVTWTGDLSAYQIDSASWPVSPAQDFAGSHSLHSITSTSGVTNTVVTAFSFNPIRPTFWSTFVSGSTAANGELTTTPRAFDLLLVSDSNSTPAIEAGTINGYRLRLVGRTGSIDSFLFQKATGSGWTTLNFLDVGTGASTGQGWNILVHRESNGTWQYGYANGTIGTPVASIDNAIVDTGILSGSFSGMSWVSPSGGSNLFGFDNFLITSIPEPSVIVFIALGLGFLVRRFRHRSITGS